MLVFAKRDPVGFVRFLMKGLTRAELVGLGNTLLGLAKLER
ncbi:MAG: hypothetical protein AB7N76_05190 [Planctomycetota bacterium]